MFARATWYASGLGFFAKRPPPWIAIVVKCSRLRTQETHKFGVQQNGDTQIQGFCSERLHAQETARHKRCFGSRGDAAHRGLLAAAGPQEVRQGHPRGATPGQQGEGASGKKQVLATREERLRAGEAPDAGGGQGRAPAGARRRRRRAWSWST